MVTARGEGGDSGENGESWFDGEFQSRKVRESPGWRCWLHSVNVLIPLNLKLLKMVNFTLCGFYHVF